MERDDRFAALEKRLHLLGLESLRRRVLERKLDGGPGSGNWGHAGRSGQRGGSAPGGGNAGIGFVPRASGAAQRRADWKRAVEEKRAETLAKKTNQQALEMKQAGIVSHEEAVRRMRDGTVGEIVNRYYDLLAENGDPTPAKPTVTEHQDRAIDAAVREQGIGYGEARIRAIMKDTGASREDAEEFQRQVDYWTGGPDYLVDEKLLDEYVRKAPAYAGKIYRGLHFEDPEDYDEFMEEVRTGTIQMRSASSWTSEPGVCRRFSHWGDEETDSVEINCVANRTGTPIEHLTAYGGEWEVLAGSGTRWTVLSVEEYTTSAGGRGAQINVMERNDYKD